MMMVMAMVSDVDECSTPANKCRYACKNTVGSFICVCPEGYIQRGADECIGQSAGPCGQCLLFPFLSSAVNTASPLPSFPTPCSPFILPHFSSAAIAVVAQAFIHCSFMLLLCGLCCYIWHCNKKILKYCNPLGGGRGRGGYLSVCVVVQIIQHSPKNKLFAYYMRILFQTAARTTNRNKKL